MKSPLLQKLIASLVIIVLVAPLAFFIPPDKVRAQEVPSVGYQYGNMPSGVSIEGLSAMFIACVLGNKKVKELLGKGFEKIGDWLGIGKGGRGGKKPGKDAESTGQEPAEAVPIENDYFKVKFKRIAEEQEKTKEEEQKANYKGQCLDAVAYAYAKELLSGITGSTINWINSGFKSYDLATGEVSNAPTFIQNPGDFFGNLFRTEILGLSNLIGYDQERFPFGRAVARELRRSIRYSFERNARFTLNEVIWNSVGEGYTYDDFYNDFTIGGWNAYLALSLPQNNPIGFRFMAGEEAARRTAGTLQTRAQNLRAELQMGDGFFSIKQCVLAEILEDVVPGESPEAPPSELITTLQENPAPQDVAWDKKDFEVDPQGDPIIGDMRCVKWANATPGQAIVNQMNITLGSTQRQLELADELNESLAAIFDALLLQLFSDEGGLVNVEYKYGKINGAGGLTTTRTTGSQIEAYLGGKMPRKPDFECEVPYLIFLQQKYIGDIDGATQSPFSFEISGSGLEEPWKLLIGTIAEEENGEPTGEFAFTVDKDNDGALEQDEICIDPDTVGADTVVPCPGTSVFDQDPESDTFGECVDALGNRQVIECEEGTFDPVLMECVDEQGQTSPNQCSNIVDPQTGEVTAIIGCGSTFDPQTGQTTGNINPFTGEIVDPHTGDTVANIDPLTGRPTTGGEIEPTEFEAEIVGDPECPTGLVCDSETGSIIGKIIPGDPGEPFRDPAPLWKGIPENNKKLDHIIKRTQQLDFCIPGPHPGWEREAEIKKQELIEEARQKIFAVTDEEETLKIIEDIGGMLSLGISTQIANWLGWGEASRAEKKALAFENFKKKLNEVHQFYLNYINSYLSPESISYSFLLGRDSLTEIRKLDRRTREKDVNEQKRTLAKEAKNKLIFLMSNHNKIKEASLSASEEEKELEKLESVLIDAVPNMVSRDLISSSEEDLFMLQSDIEYDEFLLKQCIEDANTAYDYHWGVAMELNEQPSRIRKIPHPEQFETITFADDSKMTLQDVENDNIDAKKGYGDGTIRRTFIYEEQMFYKEEPYPDDWWEEIDGYPEKGCNPNESPNRGGEDNEIRPDFCDDLIGFEKQMGNSIIY